MKLHEAISDAIERFGVELIKTERMVNFLADYRAFDDVRPAKAVLREFLKAGYGEKVYQLHVDGALDRLLKLKSYGMELMQAHGYHDFYVNHVLDSVSYGLGWIELPPEDVLEMMATPLPVVRTIEVAGERIAMIAIKSGTFNMGATPEQGIYAAYDEKPSIEVTIDDFYLCETPVTQRLWKAVMGDNPSHHQGDDLPVERVSWDECQEFIKLLNAMSSFRFRLPTEAEWEYAARGGTRAAQTKYAGADDAMLDNYAWHKLNSDSSSHAVGCKSANALGLYDMSGNVSEWCSDWYFNSYASAMSRHNPTGPSTGMNKVHRGGSWFDKPMGCRVSKRYSMNPRYKNKLVGLRLAASMQ